MKSMKKLNVVASALLVSTIQLTGCATTDGLSTTSDVVDTVTPDITLNNFVDVRLASIQQDAAKGEGENLEALADLMGKKDKQAFSYWMQSNYDVLFTDLKKPTELISRIEASSTDLM